MADLTVTITESVLLNNVDQGGSHTLTVTGVDDFYKRIVTCTNDVATTLAVFGATPNTGDSFVDIENVKYIRVTNLDGGDPVNVSLQIDTGTDGADHQTTFLLDPGKSLMLGGTDAIIATSDDTAALDTSLNDVESIIAQPTASDAAQVEIFIASVVA